MINVDESKLICVLYDHVVNTDMSPIDAVYIIKSLLSYSGAYTRDNVTFLDDQIIKIVRDRYNMWTEGNVKKEN